MVERVAQRLRWCPGCLQKTLHYKNVQTINWVMHLAMLLITAGVWIVVLVFAVLTKPLGGGSRGWVCSQCGRE